VSKPTGQRVHSAPVELPRQEAFRVLRGSWVSRPSYSAAPRQRTPFSCENGLVVAALPAHPATCPPHHQMMRATCLPRLLFPRTLGRERVRSHGAICVGILGTERAQVGKRRRGVRGEADGCAVPRPLLRSCVHGNHDDHPLYELELYSIP
jgi:hypothetical protein